jgi:hypothetical protein
MIRRALAHQPSWFVTKGDIAWILHHSPFSRSSHSFTVTFIVIGSIGLSA